MPEAAPPYIAVKDWKKHQHYHEPRPAWIKLYGALLDDPDFLGLSEVAQIQLIKLWLLASRMGHPLPNDPKLLAGKIGCRGKLHLPALVQSGLLLYANSREESREILDESLGTKTETEKREKRTTPRRAKRERKPVEGNWVSRLAAFFREKGGQVGEGQLGANLKSAHEKFGEATLRTAMGLWIAERKAQGWSCKFSKFADDHVRWCEQAILLEQALASGVDYWDNEALQQLTRPSLVA